MDAIVDAVRRTLERRTRRRDPRSLPWTTFTALGIVGWSFALPLVLGVTIGHAVDERRPGPVAWTVVGLVVGLVTGAIAAWRALSEGWRDR